MKWLQKIKFKQNISFLGQTQKRKKGKFSANQTGGLSTCPVKGKAGEALNKLKKKKNMKIPEHCGEKNENQKRKAKKTFL